MDLTLNTIQPSVHEKQDLVREGAGGHHTKVVDVLVRYKTVNHAEEDHYEKVYVKDAWNKKIK